MLIEKLYGLAGARNYIVEHGRDLVLGWLTIG